jgi:hypothetical protein
MRPAGLFLAAILLTTLRTAAAGPPGSGEEPAPSITVTIRGRLEYREDTESYHVQVQGVPPKSRQKARIDPSRWAVNLVLDRRLQRRAGGLVGRHVVIQGVLQRIYLNFRRYTLVVRVTRLDPASGGARP